MYKDFETRTSFNYLKEVINNLNEPICILGGWAVFFHVNKRFQAEQGRPYLGSRDIDLGFNMDNSSTLKEAMRILTQKLDFKPISFRLMKEFHTETEKEITKEDTVPSHFTFQMYVDLIVDSIPKDFKKRFGFNPIDEPLLKKAFEKDEHKIVKEFKKKLLLPKPELMLAMKLNSLPGRDKEHKRIKDICDIFALAWYTDLDINALNLSSYTSEKSMTKCFSLLADEDLEKAGRQLGHDMEEIRRVIETVCRK